MLPIGAHKTVPRNSRTFNPAPSNLTPPIASDRQASLKRPPKIAEMTAQIRAKTRGERKLPRLGIAEKNSTGYTATRRVTSKKLFTGLERS